MQFIKGLTPKMHPFQFPSRRLTFAWLITERETGVKQQVAVIGPLEPLVYIVGHDGRQSSIIFDRFIRRIDPIYRSAAAARVLFMRRAYVVVIDVHAAARYSAALVY
jgi:hypothetical protein